MCKTVKECIYLFSDLFIEPTTPQGSQLLLVRLFSMGSTFIKTHTYNTILEFLLHLRRREIFSFFNLKASCRNLLQP